MTNKYEIAAMIKGITKNTPLEDLKLMAARFPLSVYELDVPGSFLLKKGIRVVSSKAGKKYRVHPQKSYKWIAEVETMKMVEKHFAMGRALQVKEFFQWFMKNHEKMSKKNAHLNEIGIKKRANMQKNIIKN